MADYSYGGTGGENDLPVQPNTLMPYSPLAAGGAPLAPPPMPSLPVMPIAPQASANPWQDVARMLQGFSSGVAGRPNPVIQLEQEQERLDQNRRLLEQRMKKEDEALALHKQQMSQTLGLKLIDSPDPDLREQGYRMLQQSGSISPLADPTKLSVLGKVDYNQRRDEAISMIENGLDPSAPAMGGQYNFLPLDQYKQMYKANPMALNALRSKPQTEDQIAKGILMRVKSMDPSAVAADPSLQRQIDAASSVLNLAVKPKYSEGVNAALATIENPSTPGQGWRPEQNPPPTVVAEAMSRAQTETGPPSLERLLEKKLDLEQKVANPQSPAEFTQSRAQLERVNRQIQALQQAKRLNQVFSREDIEAQLEMQGLKKGTPAFQTAYNNLARQVPLQQGGMLVGAGNVGAGLGATGMGTGMQAAPPMAASPIGPAELARYVNKQTLQAPPPGMTAPQIQASGDYVAVPEGALQAVRQFKTVAQLFDRAEQTIKKRSDLFPESKDNILLDRANVAYAQAKWALGARTDPDIGTMESLMVALPTLVKAFGDTGNIAVQERLQAATAAGFNAATKENALARIQSIRSLTAAGATAMGFPNIIKDLTGPGAKQERIKQLVRDGKSDAEIKATLKQEGF